MENTTGLVICVTVIPGSPHCRVDFMPPRSFGISVMFDLADVTVDGQRVAVGQLVEHVMNAPGDVTVTVHPCSDRYGLSTKTEFVTKQ